MNLLPYIANVGGVFGQMGELQRKRAAQQQAAQMEALKMLEEQNKIKQSKAPGNPINIPGLGWVQVDPMTGKLIQVQGSSTQSPQDQPPDYSKLKAPSGMEAVPEYDYGKGWKPAFKPIPKEVSAGHWSPYPGTINGQPIEMNRETGEVRAVKTSGKYEPPAMLRLDALKGSKQANMYDKEKGVIREVTIDEKEKNEDRYLSAQDPNVKALQNNKQFQVATDRFINTIDQNSGILTDIVKKYQKTNSRVLNIPMNMINSKIVGSGDLASIQILMASMKAEVGKLESGSLGIRGVDVHSFMEFGKSFDEAMSLSNLNVFLGTIKKMGQTRKNVIMDENISIKEDMGSALSLKEKAYQLTKNPSESEGTISLDDYLKKNGKLK